MVLQVVHSFSFTNLIKNTEWKCEEDFFGVKSEPRFAVLSHCTHLIGLLGLIFMTKLRPVMDCVCLYLLLIGL